MSAARRIALALVAAALAGCHVRTGGDPAGHPLATSPYGSTIALEPARGGTMHGELITGDDSTFTILSGGRLLVAPIRLLRSAQVDRGPAWSLGRLPADTMRGREQREAIVRHARYPFGYPPGVLERMLAEGGQTAPDRLEDR
ncbi:MAG: hypothetical protein ACJ8AO_08895 [Gemmatimonadaceae bacterium]